MYIDIFSQTPWATLSFTTFTLAFGLFYIYHLAMPRPIPGIPYNKSSSHKLLGDVPAIADHMAKIEGGTFITYILKTMRSLNSPLIQVFIQPLSRPSLILGDFPEAYDILTRRREFDRAPTLGNLVKGIVPNMHIHLKTGDTWKNQRRLIQDLMTPSFLHEVAGPVLYQNLIVMIDLWRTKSRVADGRPWKADDDVNQMVLDALMAFSFGEEFEQSSIKPALSAVRSMNEDSIKLIKSKGRDEIVEFPRGQQGPILRVIRELTEMVGEFQGNPAPTLMWAYVTRKPKVRRNIRIKDECIKTELKKSVKRIERTSEGGVVKSAADQMIVREKILAEREGRAPDFLSRVMIDEIFGFILAGHETTATTLCWCLKYLADYPSAQSKLREALQSAFPGRGTTGSGARGRIPSIHEITSTSVPYLDATMEEMLRCSGAIPVVDRIATVDTELLGHHIPKGTVVTCLVTGPSLVSPGFDIEMSRRSPASQSNVKEGRHRRWDPQNISLYDPDRWTIPSKTRVGDIEFDPTAGPNLSFGLGARGCYGKRLAYLEMRIFLTLVVWNFELLPCPPAVSTYHAKLIASNEPAHTYVRLREIA
ncbi:cytochrome P450 monooxygenase [Xylaria sp. FL1777]|nr:cytochrome P450 monooxygenase [Xylaria sp. FL1777]